MKYWYDTEFIEDGKTIDLISIGMVSEDGRELYLVSNQYDPLKASDWVKQNVIPYLPHTEEHPEYDCIMSRRSIADEIEAFCNPEGYGKPEFWGYYSAYDHVVLCQLFGAMINLPKKWPMYTRDLKQWCDSLGNPQLPKNEGTTHHALADARWTKQAWEFLAETERKQRG